MMSTRLLLLALSSTLLLVACSTAPASGDQQNSAPAVSHVPMPIGDILLTSPLPNDLVQSPLIVQGRARGTWYFEASFPVKVLDANGNEVAAVAAQARGDWMTEDYVPFSALLQFSPPSTPTGTLVLQKDNPSGLPENDASLVIPVRFQ